MDVKRPTSLVVGTLAEQACATLRAEIVSGILKPGDRLLVRDLVERFGISHIPIRESLRTLEGEGLVESRAHRGVIVCGFAQEDLEDSYDLRKIIEPHVAQRALDLYTPEHLEKIRGSLERLEQAARGSDVTLFNGCHHEFHWLILEPGGTGVIQQTLEQLWRNSDRYVQIALSLLGGEDAFRVTHRRLYEACTSGDPQRLSIDLAAHLDETAGRLRSFTEADAAQG